MSAPDLIIAGVTIPRLASLEMTQEYGETASRARHRMGDGSLKVQENWSKLTTRISGSGWMPAAFNSIDWTQDIIIKCIAPEAVQGATTSITVPAARRDDAAPWAVAMVSGREVPTSISMAGNVATLGTVAGADFYMVRYYPLFTAHADIPPRQLNTQGASYGWTLEAEEV